MAKEIKVSCSSFRRPDIALRLGTIVLAVILIGFSVATIGFAANVNKRFPYSTDEELQDLINRSLAAAGWLTALSVGVLIAEAVIIVLAVINVQPRKLVRQILDILFSIAVPISYCATAIACATYAAEWNEPREACTVCFQGALVPLLALSAVFSIIQTAVFGFIAIWAIYAIVKSRKVQGPQ